MLVDLNLERMERTLILEALRRSDWVQKRAARLLGVSPRVLNWKISHDPDLREAWAAKRDGGQTT